MNWNRHYKLEGQHAQLGASRPNWVMDEDEQFRQRILAYYASTIGTLMHDIAKKYITHRFKMHKYDKSSVVLDLIDSGIPDRVIDILDFDAMFINLMAYVNDANAYGLDPEILLYYSDNCFGTADTIGYFDKQKILRIHDLKTGKSPAKIEQLLIYAALFCLEYHVNPEEISETELRIYQLSEVLVHKPAPTEIRYFVEQIKKRDKDLNLFLGKDIYMT